LKDIAKQLETALDNTGYYTRSYHHIPGGFALVTQAEQINDDGTPKSIEEGRWASKIQPRKINSLSSFFDAFLFPVSGRYRAFVFIVTDKPFKQSADKPTRAEVQTWQRSGYNVLPDSIGQIQFRGELKKEYMCTVLIYEFEQSTNNQEPNIVQSSLPGKMHLEKTLLLKYLGM
jgi:hypothetical protein